MTESTRAISPLRQRMIDDMTLRKLGPRTQTAYIRAVKNFTRFFGQSPDAATASRLRGIGSNQFSLGHQVFPGVLPFRDFRRREGPPAGLRGAGSSADARGRWRALVFW